MKSSPEQTQQTWYANLLWQSTHYKQHTE